MPAGMCLNKQICDCDVTLDWMSKTMHELPIPHSWESNFTPGQAVALPLHNIGMSFCIGMKISLRYSYKGEHTPV